MIRKLTISLLLTLAFLGAISQVTPSYGDLTQVMNKRTNEYNLVWKKSAIETLINTVTVSDSTYVAFGCFESVDGWYAGGDTLYIDTCYAAGTGTADSIYVVYGCYNSPDKWLYNSDTLFIDTCYASLSDSSKWTHVAGTIKNKSTTEVEIDTALTLSGLKAQIVSASNQRVLVIDDISKNVYYTTLQALIDSIFIISPADSTLWYLSGDSIRNKNSYKVFINDSVYLKRDAIPLLQYGEPVGRPLVLRKLDASQVRQLAQVDWPIFIDTLSSYGMDTSYWARTGNYLYPKTLTDSVGIGTATPTERLDVANGNINFPTTTADIGQIKQGGDIIFHTYHEKNNNNLFLGHHSGTLSLDSSFNIGIGPYTLNSLTTGFKNTSLGYEALKATTLGASNIAIGTGALTLNKEGLYNVAVGVDALRSNGDNDGSTAIGYRAMYYADSRTVSERNTYNTAIGYEAMRGSTTAANNTGVGNTAVGWAALDAMTTTEYNVAVGYNALSAATTGKENVAVGASAASALVSGTSVVAVGCEAARSLTGGATTAVGRGASFSATSGGSNDAFGYQALNYNKTGTYNTAIGLQSMMGTVNLNQSYNTAVGQQSLYGVRDNANANTSIGYRSLYYLQTGDSNVSVGYQSGYLCETGGNNVFLGFNAGYNEMGSDKLYISNSNTTTPLIYGDFAKDSVAINGTLSAALDSSSAVYSVYYNKTTNELTYDSAATGGGGVGDNLGNHIATEDLQMGAFNIDNTDTVDVNEYLDVQGNINMATSSSTVGLIKQNGTTIFHTYQDGGGQNIFLGTLAGNTSLTGNYNTIISAYESGDNLTTGYNNTWIGTGIGVSATTAYRNTCIGDAAGEDLSTGRTNVCVGYEAGQYISSGYNNVFLGYNSGFTSSTAGPGYGNVGIGVDALTVGGYNPEYNIAIGYASATGGMKGSNSTYRSSYNIIIGNQAGQSAAFSTTSQIDYNTFIGNLSGYRISYNAGMDSKYNTAIGHNAMGAKTSSDVVDGDYNTAIGNFTLQNILGGTHNVTIGDSTGWSLTTGSRNVLIGKAAGSQLTTESDLLYISNSNTTTPLILGDFSNKYVKINEVLQLTPVSTPTVTPALGMLYVDSDDNNLYFYNGTTWEQISP